MTVKLIEEFSASDVEQRVRKAKQFLEEAQHLTHVPKLDFVLETEALVLEKLATVQPRLAEPVLELASEIRAFIAGLPKDPPAHTH